MKRVVLMMCMVGGFPLVSAAQSGQSASEETLLLAAAPDTRITAGPPEKTNQTTSYFEFAATITDASFDCSLDSETPLGCLSPTRRRNISAGPHSFCVVAIDGNGQKDPTPACHTWTVDLTPPTVTISEPASGTSVSTADPQITGTTNEPSSTINVFVDGSTQSAGSVVADATGNWTFNKPLGLKDTEHTVSATATDPAGNVGVRSSEVTFKVLSKPPETSIVEHPSALHNSKHSVFEFGSSTGAQRFECQIDSAAYADCDQVALFKNLSAAPHTLRVRAKDGAGNVDPTPVEFSWTVDPSLTPSTCVPNPSGTVPGAEPQAGCASTGGSPALALGLLGGALLSLTVRRRRSS